MTQSKLSKTGTLAFLLTALLLVPELGHCFYNPSTGRWLARDPLSDMQASSFANHVPKRPRSVDASLYAFAASNPVSRIDNLGLAVNDVAQVTSPPGSCPCTCGFKVDKLINDIFTDVDKTFNGLSDDQKGNACANLFVPPWALDSWDMEGVTSLPSMPSSKLCAPCAAKVTYRGGCYDVGELNYLMFGHICGLCDKFAKQHASGSSWGADVVEAIVETGKLLRFKSVGCASEFAASGFNSKPTTCGNWKVCTPNPKSPPPSPPKWRWDGVNN